MLYKGLKDANYQDAASKEVFSGIKWEPGYTAVRMIRIINDGTMAFKYELTWPEANGASGKAKLSDVIDVYLLDPAKPITREAVAASAPGGTLSQLMAGTAAPISGNLLPAGVMGEDPAGSVDLCLVLKMQESASNDYQGSSSSFTVKASATQYNWEGDDFDNLYDDDSQGSNDAPDAKITCVSYVGETQFNIAAADSAPALSLSVAYDDTTKDIPITDAMYVVEGSYVKPDFTAAGVYSVKVAYEGFSTTFTIRVIDPSSNILITSEEFTYGAYFDHDRFSGNTGTKLTSGDYGKIRAADALLPAQDITIRVTDSVLTDYKVTLGYFTKDGIYTGRSVILPMTNGELTIPASQIGGAYFRLSVYLYNGRFTKVPESAQIVVYGTKSPVQPDQPDIPLSRWEGKKICIVGDSISTGGYPGTLANLTGAEIQNLSVSGTLLAGGLTSKIASVDENAALVIVFGGTNDYWHKNVTIGAADSTSANTFVGALRYILNSLTANHPDAEYLFVFPPDQTFGGNPSSTDFGKGTLDDFRSAFIDFCTANSVHYLDLGEDQLGFDSAQHTGDGVHPNTAGHQIIAQAISDAITEEN